MGRIDIRNIPDHIVEQLTDQAKSKHMSREAYAREILIESAEEKTFQEKETKYEALIKKMIEVMDHQGIIIERNNMLLELVLEQLAVEKRVGAINST